MSKSKMFKFALYSSWGSSSAWRVRLALGFKGVEYEYIAVNLYGDRDDLPKINPMNQIPVLVVSDIKASESPKYFTQSVAICELLEDICDQEKKLLPNDAFDRAYVRRLVEIVNSGVQPLLNNKVLNAVGEIYRDNAAENKSLQLHYDITKEPEDKEQYDEEKFVDEGKRGWVQKFLTFGLGALETEIENFYVDKKIPKTKIQYCAGSQITLADCFLIPEISRAMKYNVDLSKFPIISKIYNNLEKTEAFHKAVPANQPDYQG